MSRHIFLKSITALVGSLTLPALAHTGLKPATTKTLQHSPLAGFQYHHGETLWPQLATGQPLQLVREGIGLVISEALAAASLAS